jgi:hypothetical protein
MRDMMSLLLWWRRNELEQGGRVGRLPDGDRVLKNGQKRSVDLLPDWARERTELLPIVTPAAQSRGPGGPR